MKKLNDEKGIREQFPLSSDELRLLAELGFMAATAGHAVPAIRLFDALRILREDEAFPYVGNAIARMYVGAFNDAVRALRESQSIVKRNAEEIQLYLAFALHFAGRMDESNRLFDALLADGKLDSSQLPLAQHMLSRSVCANTGAQWPLPAPVKEEDFEVSSR